MRNPAWKVALVSLVGGLAVHGALSACGGGNVVAHASPNDCATWQATLYNKTVPITDPGGQVNALTLPPGWEPFLLDGESLILRRCAP